MEQIPGDDLISELPQHIIEIILSKLPFIEAVRTSTLSKSWRFKWVSLPEIVLDDTIKTQNMNDCLAQLMLLHKGTINKFEICSSSVEIRSIIDQWLLFASLKDVRDLKIELATIRVEPFTVPPCVFSFPKLTHLVLDRCKFSIPKNFKGFTCLKTLKLRSFDCSNDDLQILVSSCPLLETLYLLSSHENHHKFIKLSIRAQKLKYLLVDSSFPIISVYAPSLLFMSLDAYLYDYEFIRKHLKPKFHWNFHKYLGSVPKLETLTGLNITKCLAMGTRSSTYDPRLTYNNLKHIWLFNVGFYSSKEVLVVLRLIDSCPNLCYLDLWMVSMDRHYRSSSDDDAQLLDDSVFRIRSLDRLKRVELIVVSGYSSEMKLVKLLLLNSPCLEEMNIHPDDTKRSEVLNDWSSFNKASPRAVVVVRPNPYG